jgi:MoxR-like ATPase
MYHKIIALREDSQCNDIVLLKDKIEIASAELEKVIDGIENSIIGQQDMIKKTIIAMLAGEHVLIEGLPGLAKTTFLKTLAKTINGDFNRVQFTPDLLPADIIGTRKLDPHTNSLIFEKGPVFTNILLADEINRSPAKVQAALLEAMGEKQVTVGKETYSLPNPFWVFATQNPLDQEGTYPLPEAQLDRFMFKITVPQPTLEEETAIMELVENRHESPEIESKVTLENIKNWQRFVSKIFMDKGLKEYAAQLVCATRKPSTYKGMEKYKDVISVGASTRASLNLMKAAKAHAFIKKRSYVTADDIKAVAPDVLRHRIILNYNAAANNIKVDDIINAILNNIPIPENGN